MKYNLHKDEFLTPSNCIAYNLADSIKKGETKFVKIVKDLVEQIHGAHLIGNPLTGVSSIVADSRKAKPGSLFVAIAGHHVDGATFAENAIQSGAVAILTEKELPLTASQIIVPDLRRSMEVLVPYFFDYPGEKMRMIGVTGTNGKTTTAFLIHHLLITTGIKSGLIGTIYSLIGNQRIDSVNTTPDIVDLQYLLSQMKDSGIKEIVMEVSSHALTLNRVAGCEFDIGVFTNLTQDHLDFHHTMEEYRGAKEKLFYSLKKGNKINKRSVINSDDPSKEYFCHASAAPVWTYGYGEKSDFKVLKAKISQKGTEIEILTPEGVKTLQSSLVGDFNVYNILAAVGAVRAEGVSWEDIQKGITSFTGVPGRFQQISNNTELPLVVVDYAHTPDGLKNVLETGRRLTSGRLITVFGCGGDRDRTKRPLMGAIGRKLADEVILTSDNPRSEDPNEILREILVAWKDEDKKPQVVVDRREAIQKAILSANLGDVVIISGKGHENYQILKDKTIHFDDSEEALRFLEEKYGRI